MEEGQKKRGLNRIMRIKNYSMKSFQIVERRDDNGKRELQIFVLTNEGLFTGILVENDPELLVIDYEPVVQLDDV